MNSIIDNIMKFQKDRNLDKQKFDWINESTNIIEEILEIQGYSVPKEKREKLKELVETSLNTIINSLQLKQENKDLPVDGLADIIIFAVGGMMKMGYNPKCVLTEAAKEINSRTGKIIDGKFIKDTSEEAKKRWYKADYSYCKSEKKD